MSLKYDIENFAANLAIINKIVVRNIKGIFIERKYEVRRALFNRVNTSNGANWVFFYFSFIFNFSIHWG